jgi:hypothetical protein
MIKNNRSLLTLLATLTVNIVCAQNIASDVEPVFIGWSATGKAALGVKATADENNTIEYHYKIVDVVTDKIMYSKTFMLGYAAFANGFAEESINLELEEFYREIGKFNIIKTEKNEVFHKAEEIIVDTTTYRIKLNEQMENNIVKRYQLSIDNGSKKKPIAVRDVTDSNMKSIAFVFATVSPDKKRIVVAVAGKKIDSTLAYDVQFFGSNLITGFK